MTQGRSTWYRTSATARMVGFTKPIARMNRDGATEIRAGTPASSHAWVTISLTVTVGALGTCHTLPRGPLPKITCRVVTIEVLIRHQAVRLRRSFTLADPCPTQHGPKSRLPQAVGLFVGKCTGESVQLMIEAYTTPRRPFLRQGAPAVAHLHHPRSWRSLARTCPTDAALPGSEGFGDG